MQKLLPETGLSMWKKTLLTNYFISMNCSFEQEQISNHSCKLSLAEPTQRIADNGTDLALIPATQDQCQHMLLPERKCRLNEWHHGHGCNEVKQCLTDKVKWVFQLSNTLN